MSGFKRMFKLARRGLAVAAVLAVAAWAQEPQLIEIRSFEDLQKIGKDPAYPLWEAYMLMADITMEPGWEPIGKWSVDSIEVAELCHPIGGCPNPIDVLFADPFRGSFHGNGRTIKGLSVNIDKSEQFGRSEPAPLVVSGGLFGALSGAKVVGLTIEADSVIVSGSHEVAAGILAGFSRYSSITSVSVRGTVSAVATSIGVSIPDSGGAVAGGLVGKAAGGSIVDCKSEVTVISESRSLLSSSITPPRHNNRIGGFAGGIETTSIRESHATVTLAGDGVSAGGIAGENFGGSIHQSSARTSGTDLGFLNVGGLAGVTGTFYVIEPCPPEMVICLPTPWGATIIQSYSVVNMNRSYAQDQFMGEPAKIGGLVGVHGAGHITNSYSIGTLTSNFSEDILGGLAGTIDCNDIGNSYSAVTMSNGPENVGGLVGMKISACRKITVNNSYWDVDVSGIDVSSDGGHGKATDEMMSQSTFSDWDFNTLWRIDEGNSYPYLAWEDGGSSSISRDIASHTINRNSLAPTAAVRGKTLNVRTSSPANLQVRLIDMRGRTLIRFTTEGNGGNFSLSKISAGRYFVEMRDMSSGRRFTSAVIVR